MPDPTRPPFQLPTTIGETREWHLEDRPNRVERSALLAAIHARLDAKLAKEQPPPKAPPWLGKTARTCLGIGTSAAVAMTLGLWLLQSSTIHLAPDTRSVQHSTEATSRDQHASVELSRLATSQGPTISPCTIARGDDGLVADFEQPTQLLGARPTIVRRDGRDGTWVHRRNRIRDFWDAQPLLVATSPEATPASQSALEIAGPAPTGAGASAGLRLKHCYDASAYSGIEFRARGPGPVFVALQTLSSVPTQQGGHCTDKCWFTGGRYIALSDRFETYRIRWQDVVAPEPDYDVSKELLEILFVVQSGPTPYSFWLDDVKFVHE